MNKTIKLTGHFNKTFSVQREENGYKGLEYSIEWDFDKKQTRIPLSEHGAIELSELFDKIGFTQIHRKSYDYGEEPLPLPFFQTSLYPRQ